MTAWVATQLGDVAHIAWGDTTKTKAAYTESGYIAFSASGPDGYMDHFDHEGPGVVLSAIGAQCGKTWFAQGKWSCIKNTIYLTARPGKINPRFLYYITCDQGIWPIRGAAQPFISQTDARAISVRLPSAAIQGRIASILSTYDDLIENNMRRIAILEEMARRIYEEWFVRFRFPGHENVRMVESELGLVPDGWAVVRLDQILVLQRGFDLPTKARSDGPYRVIAATGEHGTHKESRVKGPGVVTGRSGSLGAVLYIEEDFWPLNTTLWVKEYVVGSPLFAFFVLRSIDLAGFNSGAAVPTLNRNDVHGLPVMRPTADVLSRFDEVVEPLMQLARTLKRKNMNLRTTRDLLLPKLISGELDVAALPALEAAAA